MRIPALIVTFGVLLTVGCASKEEPAKAAVDSAEAALNEVRPDAQKYAPGKLQAAEASLAGMKSDLEHHKYTAVLLAAPKLRQETQSLEETTVSVQTQMAAATNEWEELKVEVPRLVAAIQNRVDNLKGSRLPPNLKKETLEAARADLVAMKATWAEASAAFSAGKATEAADKGRTVQAKAKLVSEQLEMSPA